VILIDLENITKKEFGKKTLKNEVRMHKTKEDTLKEIHEFLIKTKTKKKKKNTDLKEEIKKAIKTKKEEVTIKKRIIKTRETRPYFVKDYFQPPVNELPKLNYEKLFSYLGSGVKEHKTDGYFEQQIKRIHANETTIEREEAYAIIKEKAWSDTVKINTGHLALRNEGTFAYWALFNDALNKVMYESSFSVNL